MTCLTFEEKNYVRLLESKSSTAHICRFRACCRTAPTGRTVLTSPYCAWHSTSTGRSGRWKEGGAGADSSGALRRAYW